MPKAFREPEVFSIGTFRVGSQRPSGVWDAQPDFASGPQDTVCLPKDVCRLLRIFEVL